MDIQHLQSEVKRENIILFIYRFESSISEGYIKCPGEIFIQFMAAVEVPVEANK